MTANSDQSREGTWHFLDKRSKALARNSDGLKLEFATHSDAVLGKAVLEAKNNAVSTLREQLATQKARADSWEEVADKLAVMGAPYEELEAERDKLAEQKRLAVKALTRIASAPYHETEAMRLIEHEAMKMCAEDALTALGAHTPQARDEETNDGE